MPKRAKAYILYRGQRTRIREAKSDLMDAVAEILVETNRENANVSNSPSAKMLPDCQCGQQGLLPEQVDSGKYGQCPQAPAIFTFTTWIFTARL